MFLSLGVDLIEFKRVKSFYKEHRASLGLFFDRWEVAYVQNSRKPYVALAELLGAKEAVYKALGGCVRELRVVSGKQEKIFFKGLQISFFRNKKYLVVKAVSKNKSLGKAR